MDRRDAARCSTRLRGRKILRVVNRGQLQHFLQDRTVWPSTAEHDLRPAAHLSLLDAHSRRIRSTAADLRRDWLAVGNNEDTNRYYGHIGYNVFPVARGHHYAERRPRDCCSRSRYRHGMHTLWVTCNPDNQRRRRTCERLGAQYVETIAVPTNHPLYVRRAGKVQVSD